ncbi:MAG: hypothetical protein LBV00_01250 [Propionibacteriaceae bacterium]|nr:hypothetical protein [Propionibacteriaceae bacterium]
MPDTFSESLAKTLRQEVADGNGRMREALFLTFCSGLSFFEASVLNLARQTGAAVTVIADPSVHNPDPRGIREAGLRYCLGMARVPGAFHPKVMLLVGENNALLTVGSGNLTMAGWHLNRETLTVLKGDSEEGLPQGFEQVSSWLADLPEYAALGDSSRAGLNRVHTWLTALIGKAPVLPSEIELLHNLRQPLIDQLPTGPVDELRVLTPFHDPTGAAAVHAAERTGARRIVVLVQNGRTLIDEGSMQERAANTGIEIEYQLDPDERYVHGKVLEGWHDEKLEWTLTGSPNLTQAAMCKSTENGGNCELAVLAHSPAVLIGQGRTLSAGEIVSGPRIDLSRASIAAHLPVFLEASLEHGVITLHLADVLQDECVAEYNEYLSDDPHAYQILMTLKPGKARYEVRAADGICLPIRVRLRREQTVGVPTFVNDPVQIQRRQLQSSGQQLQSLTLDDLFLDASQRDTWWRLLSDMPAITASSPRPSPPRSDQDTSMSRGYSGPIWGQDEAEYDRMAEEQLGSTWYRYALGLPRVGSTPVRHAAWEDDFSSSADSLGGRMTDPPPLDGPEDETTHAATPPVLDKRSKRHVCQWVSKLAKRIPEADEALRPLFARIVLASTRRPIWDTTDGGLGEEQWFPLLVKAAQGILGYDSTAHRRQVQALTQVMLVELGRAAQSTGTPKHIDAYFEVEAALLPHLERADDALLEEYASTLRTHADVIGWSDPDMIRETVHQVETSDSCATLLRRMRMLHSSWTVTPRGPHVFNVVTADKGALLTAANFVEDAREDSAVFVEDSALTRVFAAQARNVFLLARVQGVGTRYSAWELTHLHTPMGIVRSAGTENVVQPTWQESPWRKVPSEGATLLERFGISTQDVEHYLCG